MHIGREFNQKVDQLSKEGLLVQLDGMHIMVKIEATIFDVEVFPFPG